MTHLRASLVSMNPYSTSSKKPLFSPSPMSVSMTASNFVRFSNTRSDNSSLKSFFHSFKLNTNGSTNLTNSFQKSWLELKLIRIDKHSFVSCQLFITLFISRKRSDPKNNFFYSYDFVYCKIAFNEPYFTSILGYLSNSTSQAASQAVITFFY